MALVTGMSHGVELAKALGLEIEGLYSFTITVVPDDVIRVEATYHCQEENMIGFQEVIKQFTLASHDGN